MRAAPIFPAWPTSSPVSNPKPPQDPRNAPLADRLRPRAGRGRRPGSFTGPDGAIGRMVAAGKLSSMILWGPPGTGKTTIARLLADAVGLRFVAISAVFSGVADLKKVFAEAREHAGSASARCCSWTRSTASTARSRTASCPMSRTAPSRWSARRPKTRRFELNAALLSRAQVLILHRLDHAALEQSARARRGDWRAAPSPHPRSARRAGRQRRRRRPLPAQPGRDAVLGRPARPLDPAGLATSSSAASRSTTRTARAITTSSPRSTNRCAAATRRRRFIISRGC